MASVSIRASKGVIGKQAAAYLPAVRQVGWRRLHIVGSAAGSRLLAGGAKLLAMIIMLLCLVVFPFAGAFVGLPAAVAAWSYRGLREQNR